MASQYPPNTPNQSDVNGDESSAKKPMTDVEQSYLKTQDEAQKEFVRNIDWASF